MLFSFFLLFLKNYFQIFYFTTDIQGVAHFYTILDILSNEKGTIDYSLKRLVSIISGLSGIDSPLVQINIFTGTEFEKKGNLINNRIDPLLCVI